MDFKINYKGLDYLDKQKREINKFLYIGPILIIIVTFLMITANKNHGLLILGIFLSFVFAFGLALGFFILVFKYNKTIKELKIQESNITFITPKVLFLGCKIEKIQKSDVVLREDYFNVYSKEKQKGYKVITPKSEFILILDFFDNELNNLLIKHR